METHQIEGVELVLAHPDQLDIEWVGQAFLQEQLLAAWMRIDDDDLALSPRILGRPGVGKTSLAYATGRALGREVYIVQATMDTRPEDLLVTPVLAEHGKLRYHASGLVTAMIRGGVCVLDEGNRMTEKSWASLAPLLDTRRYVESVVAGIKIRAHPNFLFCATMNEDASTFEIPEYIHSRLQPRIVLDFPDRVEELEILRANLPRAEEELLGYLADFLERAHAADERYSVRDGVNIGRYALKMMVAHEKGDLAEIQPPGEFRGPVAVGAPPVTASGGGAGSVPGAGRESGIPDPAGIPGAGARGTPREKPPAAGPELENWFLSALEEVLSPGKRSRGGGDRERSGDPGSPPRRAGGAVAPTPRPLFGTGSEAPPPPATPLQRALARAVFQILGDEALIYLEEPGRRSLV